MQHIKHWKTETINYYYCSLILMTFVFQVMVMTFQLILV